MKNSLLLVLFYFFYANVLQAQERIFLIDSVKNEYRLNDFTYFYADSTNQISLEQVKTADFSKKMQVYHFQNVLPKSYHTYWYKLKIHNQVKTHIDFTLELGDFPVMEFYLLNSRQQLIRQQKTGKNVPFSQRAWDMQADILPFTVPYQDTLTLIVQVRIAEAYEPFKELRLTSLKNSTEAKVDKIEPQLLYLGAMFLMFFYNLLFFFMVRDRAYLYYALYIFSMACVSFDNTSSVLRENPYGTELLTNFTALFITLLYTQFIRYFLNIPQIRPILNRYCDYWVYARSAFIIVLIWIYIESPKQVLDHSFVLFVFILDILLGLWFIYKAWKKNPILSAYMVLGYLAMTLPLSFAIFKQIIQIEVSPDTDGVIVQMGVIIELVTFSLGLGYRSKVAEKEKLRVLEENRQIILGQNVVLEQKVTARTIELNEQKQAVEERNKHIMQNINYARRIQEAFLPKEEHIRKYLADFFILFKPRDVVSGDFYFFEKVENKIIIAAIDCTGHGVSGAFMTMLGNEILHKLVDNDRITSPDLLLNELHKGVRQALKQAETENRDGMDLSVITIEKTERNNISSRNVISKVSFAGAKNPLIYIQNAELFLLKADKTPIGGVQQEQERIFTKTDIEINSPTMFYLFTDGFQDQFGGAEKRKFTISKMKTLFLEIHEKPLTEQKEILDRTFENWRTEANEKQIDDVLIIGLRI